MSRAFAFKRLALPAGCFGVGLASGLYLRQRVGSSAPPSAGVSATTSVDAATPTDGPVDLFGAVGNTPLLELKTLSKLTGCKIYAKAEFMNPGGSVKDRAAKYLILDAEAKGQLAKPGDTLIEATGGNTGVSLALLAAARGYKTIFTMHNQIVPEKIELMRVLGAQVELQTPASWLDRDKHFYHAAHRIAAAAPKNSGVCYPDQFENTANMRAHYEGTGPEIWRQVRGNIDGFVAAAGTAGTLAGSSKFLKEKKPDVAVWLVDPDGSASMSLFINNGRSTNTPKDGFDMVPVRNGSSIAEGVALPRVTPNFRQGVVDRGITGTNQEIVDMAYFLLRNDGIFVGPSAALNVVGAVKMARELGPGHTIVTILCDGGDRYRSKLYNPKWLEEMKLKPRNPDNSDSLAFVGELSFPKK